MYLTCTYVVLDERLIYLWYLVQYYAFDSIGCSIQTYDMRLVGASRVLAMHAR